MLLAEDPHLRGERRGEDGDDEARDEVHRRGRRWLRGAERRGAAGAPALLPPGTAILRLVPPRPWKSVDSCVILTFESILSLSVNK